MSDAAYHREYRKGSKWKKWSKKHESTPGRIAQKKIARRKYAKENKEKVEASKIKYRQSGRDYARSLKDVPCSDCGGRFPVVCMDFDHREGEEKHPRLTYKENGYRKVPISMTALATQNIEAFKLEVKKCDIVCANCHRIRTSERTRKNAETVVSTTG